MISEYLGLIARHITELRDDLERIWCKNGPGRSSEELAEGFVCLAADPGLCNRTELHTCIVNVQLYVRQSQSCC